MNSGNADTSISENNPLEESSVTMLDVLEQEQEMEEEYAAVLGASDEKCCTYSQGAVKRQALYSCLTCCPEARTDLSKCAGICLACSYRCHENHELVELYTKRNFRCDCPTELLAGNRCVLNANSDMPLPKNIQNIYNQNFQGLYCICERPYPDPERTTEETMLQCSVCEDWYHLHHLDVPSAVEKVIEACTEIICGGCMKKHQFLQDYSGYALSSIEAEPKNGESNDNKLHSDLDKSISEIMNMSGEDEADKADKLEIPTKVNDAEKPTTDALLNQEKNEKEVAEPICKRAKIDASVEKSVLENNESNSEENKELKKDKCRRLQKKSDYEKGATFWTAEWRTILCQCIDCMDLYKQQKVEFLLDLDDSAKSYEERGKTRVASECASSYEQGIRALATMGHTQQIDAIVEYNKMKEKLMKYLQTFAANNKVVTEEDINCFFEQMRNENTSAVGQPYFCR